LAELIAFKEKSLLEEKYGSQGIMFDMYIDRVTEGIFFFFIAYLILYITDKVWIAKEK